MHPGCGVNRKSHAISILVYVGPWLQEETQGLFSLPQWPRRQRQRDGVAKAV